MAISRDATCLHFGNLTKPGLLPLNYTAPGNLVFTGNWATTRKSIYIRHSILQTKWTKACVCRKKWGGRGQRMDATPWRFTSLVRQSMASMRVHTQSPFEYPTQHQVNDIKRMDKKYLFQLLQFRRKTVSLSRPNPTLLSTSLNHPSFTLT